jgi:hypothetical protein
MVGKWQREIEATKMKQQSILTANGVSPNPHVLAVKAEVHFILDDCLCPFCLQVAKSSRFLVINSKGKYDNRLGLCPYCNKKIMWKTLRFLDSATAEMYAEWVFNYRMSGFWQKINFSEWKKRLYVIGWAEDFWSEYRKRKGDSDVAFDKDRLFDNYGIDMRSK